MKHVAVALLSLITAGMATPVSLDACGDKFLSLGRGTRYERSPVARQASAVLIYSNPASELSATLTKLSVDVALHKAGYQARIVTAADLDRTLRGTAWDLILVDGADVGAVAPRLAATGAPHVVPVLFHPTKNDVKHTLAQYGTAIVAPTKSHTFIDAIDDAMWDRESARRAAERKARQ